MKQASRYFSNLRHKHYLVSLMAGLVTAGVLWLLLELLITLDERNHQQQNEAQLAEIRTRLESALNLVSNASASFSFYIQSYQGVLKEEQLESMAKQLLQRYPMVNHLALAPGDVIRWIFPLEGNEAALGVDLNQVPGQAEPLTLIRQQGQPLLTGPVELVQGGKAVIHRIPVFLRDQEGAASYWGLVSTPILLNSLLESAEVLGLIETGRLAIRGQDGQGAQGEAFAGDEHLFVRADSLKARVRALDGEWQLAFIGDKQVGHLSWLRYLSWLVALLPGVLVYRLLIRNYEDQQQTRLSREYADQTAERLRVAQKEEARLNYIMAHHFQEPARRLVIFSDQLLRQPASQDQQTLTSLQFIRQQAHYLLDLIKGMQRFIEVGSRKVNYQTLALDQLLREEIRSGSLASQLADCVELEVTPWPAICASEYRMRELFRVLLENAYQHARTNQPLKIRISVEGGRQRLLVRVEDNGKGLEPQYFGQALELFVRLNPQASEYSGTGLGLPLAKRIVEQAGGTLKLAVSDLGGLQVIFDLPLAGSELCSPSQQGGQNACE
ncbi:sensor domain CHASE-containing protein [Marinospirillum celere]|uniref:histidine kinase n=1 Tax=Marinospirillum celere TaxID=1122252 RepID=A0A1I1J903_9GAMM|nr:ATP-binding protein [Marinospirillum celere]SFC44472.1 sensor domain CHASE-containing protein [Marinospirillum celere]